MNLIMLENNEFKNGIFCDVELVNKCLMLKKDSLIGTYESEEIKIDKFKKIIASWNSNTSETTSIEVHISFSKNKKWSMWFSYGQWSTDGFNKGSVSNQVDDLGNMNIDTINVFGFSDNVKIKVVFRRNHANNNSPLLHRIVLSSYNIFSESKPKLVDIDIKVPRISQMDIPQIGSVICSPTSLSMIINKYGYSKDTSHVAQNCFDNGSKIYGNWTYNIAYASEIGFKSYVRFCENVEVLFEYIKSGKPVIASIKTADITELVGAPQTYPSGHLIVIRGILSKEKPQIIVNDPAVIKVKEVKKYYDLYEFIKVWNKIIYVLEK